MTRRALRSVVGQFWGHIGDGPQCTLNDRGAPAIDAAEGRPSQRARCGPVATRVPRGGQAWKRLVPPARGPMWSMGQLRRADP
jgi:hypothetical protein